MPDSYEYDLERFYAQEPYQGRVNGGSVQHYSDGGYYNDDERTPAGIYELPQQQKELVHSQQYFELQQLIQHQQQAKEALAEMASGFGLSVQGLMTLGST